VNVHTKEGLRHKKREVKGAVEMRGGYSRAKEDGRQYQIHLIAPGLEEQKEKRGGCISRRKRVLDPLSGLCKASGGCVV